MVCYSQTEDHRSCRLYVSGEGVLCWSQSSEVNVVSLSCLWKAVVRLAPDLAWLVNAQTCHRKAYFPSSFATTVISRARRYVEKKSSTGPSPSKTEPMVSDGIRQTFFLFVPGQRIRVHCAWMRLDMHLHDDLEQNNRGESVRSIEKSSSEATTYVQNRITVT